MQLFKTNIQKSVAFLQRLILAVRLDVHVDSSGVHIVDLPRDILDLLKVDGMNLARVGLFSHLESSRDGIDSDDFLGSLQERPLDRTDSDGATTPDGNHVSLLDSGIDDRVVGSG